MRRLPIKQTKKENNRYFHNLLVNARKTRKVVQNEFRSMMVMRGRDSSRVFPPERDSLYLSAAETSASGRGPNVTQPPLRASIRLR